MQTDLQLDDALIAEARELAARSGRTLNEVIEDALRRALMPLPRRSEPPYSGTD